MSDRYKFIIQIGAWIDGRPPLNAVSTVVAEDIGEAIDKLDESEDSDVVKMKQLLEDAGDIDASDVSAVQFRVTRQERVPRKRPRKRRT